MIEVKGSGGIVAKVLKHSVSAMYDVEIITYELTYPRIIHSEFMTHRMFSRNAASSRAIPWSKMKEQLGARPVRFGQANPGMQDKGVDFNAIVQVPNYNGPPFPSSAQEAWEFARDYATEVADELYKAGYHKQVYNRLVEPFQFIKVVVTATEMANFFWLRDDGAADPTIAELARVMKIAATNSEPQVLYPGEYHTPYVDTVREDGILYYSIETEMGGEPAFLTLSDEEAIIVSSARCAAVSFRNVDYGLDKSREVFQRLVTDQRVHGSALEHVATPMEAAIDNYPYKVTNVAYAPQTWEKGITHMDAGGGLWSGNFHSWIQYRQLIPGQNKAGFGL